VICYTSKLVLDKLICLEEGLVNLGTLFSPVLILLQRNNCRCATVVQNMYGYTITSQSSSKPHTLNLFRV